MKAVLFAVLTLNTFMACNAFANDKDVSQPTDPVWRAYTQQINLICPTKHLDLLRPADLRDALDAYKERQTATDQEQMLKAETKSCKGVTAGATCDNFGDIKLASQTGKLAPLARDICDHVSKQQQ
ncbi:hypothetical protein GOZ78_03175 [Agrobacterium vitis]|uniref:Uncharacterized protein n=1 Tax=Agrobacterium vitis TaxID=373 RepID=A0AAE4WIT0_AGRVI|nr:hypothetical protein [Agrobacterium vitis]MCF1497099.1 hypothetical protein [Allorhizobium sp. Av2]MCM2443448.1 hypothetical protein [Agrobacterium vitis]MUO77900.1 hypothetical protein [Agrobacterium vitis]MUO93418.1 hypothetical protein [Agrobacterium vitis]MUP04769.1 hypothetical protein [Agrobacterium vitis]